jgi:hypothetical protein
MGTSFWVPKGAQGEPRKSKELHIEDKTYSAEGPHCIMASPLQSLIEVRLISLPAHELARAGNARGYPLVPMGARGYTPK